MAGRRQTTIRVNPAAIESWVRGLSDVMPGAWSRGTEIEQKARRIPDDRWPICLVWSGEGSHTQTAFYLYRCSDSEIEVSVVPIGRRALPDNDRQAAVDSFRRTFILPRGEDLALEDKLVPVTLVEVMSPRAASRFREFTDIANKTRLQHDLDLLRWYDFLIQLHRDPVRPPRDVVEELLRDRGFSEEVIRRLFENYDVVENLLSRYDQFKECEW
jgi:hypothetical protein